MNVLYIEDYAMDAELVRDALIRRAPEIHLDTVTTVAEAINCLNRHELLYGTRDDEPISGGMSAASLNASSAYDLVLTDFQLPDGTGLDILAHVRQRSLLLAVVVLTGIEEEELVFSALHAGADDYVVKRDDYLKVLPYTLQSALEQFRESTRSVPQLKVLYAEPNAADAELTIRELARRAPHIHLSIVSSAGEVLERMMEEENNPSALMPDVLLLDYRLPGMTAIDLIRELHLISKIVLPIILVTGQGNEQIAKLAIKLGVADYIVKSDVYLERLSFALESAFYRSASARERMALLKSERDFYSLADNLPDLITRFDRELRHTYVNAAVLKVSGRPLSHFMGKIISEIGIPPATVRVWEEAILKCFETGINQRVDVEFRDVTETRYFDMLVVPERIPDGKIASTLAIARDITQRRHVEEAMRDSEHQLLTIADNMFGIVSRTDKDLRYLFVNAGYERMFNRPRSEFIGRTVSQIVGPEFFAMMEPHFKKALCGEMVTVETQRQCIVGEVIYDLMTLIPDFAEDGSVQGMFISGIDITARKKAEIALREREQQLSVITNNSPSLIAQLDINLRFVFVNELYEKRFGIPAEKIIGMGLEELLGKKAFKEREPSYRLALTGEPVVYEGTYFSGDQEAYFLSNLIPDRAPDGSIKGLFSTIQNITERRKAERTLREHEQHLSVVTNNFPGLIARIDLDGRYLYVSTEYGKHLGLSADQIIGKTVYEVVPAENAQFFEKDIQRALAGEQFSAERTMWHSSKPAHYIVTMVPEYDQDAVVFGVTIIYLDVTDLKQVEIALLESERFSRSTLDALPGNIAVIDETGNILSTNKAWRDFGREHDRVLENAVEGSNYLKICEDYGNAGNQHITQIAQAIRTVISGQRMFFTLEYERALPSAQAWYSVNLTRFPGDGPVRVVLSHENISARKLNEQRIERLVRTQAMHSDINSAIARIHEKDTLLTEICRIVTEQSSLGTWVALLDESTNQLRSAACWGRFDRNVLDDYVVDIASIKVQQQASAAQAIVTRKSVVIENIQEQPDIGYVRREAVKSGYCSVVSLPLIINAKAIGILNLYSKEAGYFNDSEVQLLEDLAADISVGLEYLAQAERIKYLAYHDVLTGLPNRISFEEQLEASTQIDGKNCITPTVIALFDIARFRLINDSFGRQAGDVLIKLVAIRMRALDLPVEDMARVESNCFGLVLHQILSESEAGAALENILQKVFTLPFMIDGNAYHVKAKCGAVLCSDPKKNIELLLRQAELALLQAKDSVETVAFYKAHMDQGSAEALHMENKLRRAIELNQFVLHYQPKLTVADRTINSVEALIRWQDPETGMVPPGLFIPILEKTGMIFEVGRWVMQQAAADYQSWQERGFIAPRVAVNVSSLQLGHHHFVPELRNVAGSGTASGLDIEITESVIMDNMEDNIIKLQAARELGMSIAIDDFGTGYSSLSYLAKLPVNTLKIDRSFILEMTTGQQGALLVGSIITLAHSLKLKVVAEGVETQEQFDMLEGMGCDEIQGYLISRPVSVEVLEKMLKKDKKQLSAMAKQM